MGGSTGCGCLLLIQGKRNLQPGSRCFFSGEYSLERRNGTSDDPLQTLPWTRTQYPCLAEKKWNHQLKTKQYETKVYSLYTNATPFLWSCNNEDDVEEIFASGTWHVVDFYGKANWDKRNGEPKYNAMAHNPDKTIATEGRKALDIIHGFNITFKADGTFTGSIQNGTIEGTWQADGKDRQ